MYQLLNISVDYYNALNKSSLFATGDIKKEPSIKNGSEEEGNLLKIISFNFTYGLGKRIVSIKLKKVMSLLLRVSEFLK